MFWLLSALLVAAALAFILVPLLRKSRGRKVVTRDAINVSVYRDQLRELDADLASGAISRESHAEALRDIERRILEDTAGGGGNVARDTGGRRAAVAAALTVPVLAASLYVFVGTPQALLPESESPAHTVDAQQVEAMVERLAQRMRENPDDPQGWVILARSYAVMERFPEAAKAYAAAVERVPNDAQLLADYADTLAMAQGRSLEGEPEKLIAKALAIDPNNVKALALSGTIAFEKGDYARAASQWERIVRDAPADSPLAQSVRSSIEKARALAATEGTAPGAKASATAAASAPAKAATKSGKDSPSSGSAVSGTVQLAPEVAAQVAPGDTLFVFARAAEGPRMPVAIVRAQAKDLPLEFTLDDRSSMMGVKLSEQKAVIVGARISKSGSATPQPGDIQGYSKPVAPGAQNLRIVVSEITK
jgi:cytochrome c-type biogenesis protein CcmH